MHEAGQAQAEVVVPCHDLDDTLQFFTDRLGFRLDAIFPADRPQVAVVSGFGVRLRLDTHAIGDPGTMRIIGRGPTRTLKAPNGTVVEMVNASSTPVVPSGHQSLTVTRGSGAWGVGRASMQYRDLIPDRQGGRFIASHIRIELGGPVPDYVHFHAVRFQMIYCRRGWVRLVYEDQGQPFVMNEGDCVLQPPRIRHRVLDCSPGLEVIEVGCPAEHPTLVEHEIQLPTPEVLADRDFGGQRFVRHIAADATWGAGPDGFEARDTGIGAATGGLAAAVVWRPTGSSVPPTRYRCQHELWFGFVLRGGLTVDVDGGQIRLDDADAMTVPSGAVVRFVDVDPGTEVLSVCLPARPAIERLAIDGREGLPA